MTSALTNEEFEKRVLDLGTTTEQFEPTATYDPDGDCIEFLTSPEPFYAERVDGLVTVYYGQESREVIGSLIKGVARFCKKLLDEKPAFRIVITDGRVRLSHLFLAHLMTSEHSTENVHTITYRKLIKAADAASAEVEALPLLNAA